MTLASGVVAGSNGEVGGARVSPWHGPPGSTWAVPPSSSLTSRRPNISPYHPPNRGRWRRFERVMMAGWLALQPIGRDNLSASGDAQSNAVPYRQEPMYQAADLLGIAARHVLPP